MNDNNQPTEMRHDFSFHEYALCWEHSNGKGTYARYSHYGQTCETRTVYGTYREAREHFRQVTGR